MINRFSDMMCWLILVAAFVVTGCEQEHKEEASVYELLTDPNFVMPEYASRAIEATGGLEAWMKTKKLELDCVVTLYKPDGSFYLTEQHHEIYPWLNSVRISAEEPQGKFIWQLSGGIFSVLEGAEQVDALPIAIENRDFAEAILNITTAPVRFLDESFEFTEGTKPVKIKGQWYYPIVRSAVRHPAGDSPGERAKIPAVDVADIPYWPKTVFLQNRDKNRDGSRVDMLWFVAAGKEKLLAVRSYDYKEVEKGSILVPAKIEIFVTEPTGILRERLVKIDYYLLKVTE